MRKIFLLLFLVSGFLGFSQVEDAWVYFKDKPNSQSYIDAPLTMLSQRALDRRTAQKILLVFNDVPIFQSYIDEIAASTGIAVKAKSKWMNCLHIRGLQADINALKSKLFVDHVDYANKTLNIAGKMAGPLKIKAVNKVLNTSINYNYGSSANQIQMLKGDLLHQQNFTGSDKIIAVLDAGFPGVNTALPFQRLISNNQILGGYDYVNKSNEFYSGDSHGTYVLSTIGGYLDGQLIGTAPDAKYYLFITEDAVSLPPYNENPVEESNWVEAAEEADRLGVDIITSSLGYFAFDNPAYSHTYSDLTGNSAFASKGANIAFSKGIFVVASAGNEGGTIDEHIGVPSEALDVLGVGAVDASRNYASFSSIGPSFDNRVKPDVMAQGSPAFFSNTTGNIVSGNGTSFSCPIMAGMVACLWQAYPSKTNVEIKQLIIESADKFANPTAQYGFGIPNFSQALTKGNLSVTTFSKTDIIIYPNPTTDIISVIFPPGSEKATISIYTLLGQKVLEKKITSQLPSVSIKSLSNGLYLYKMESEGFSKSGKVVKQ